MSKPTTITKTTKQTLEWVNEEISYHKKRLDSSINMGWQDKAAISKAMLMRFEDIRALIESSDKGPEVDEEFVKKYAKKFAWKIGKYKSVIGLESAGEILRDMLREAGVRVEEKNGNIKR